MQARASSFDKTAGGSQGRDGSRAPGFTLIEILIVISIIALLSSFVLVAVTKGKQAAAEAIVTTQISSLSGALERYVDDEATARILEATGLPLKENVNLVSFSSQLNDIVRFTMLRRLSLPYSRKELCKLEKAFLAYEKLSTVGFFCQTGTGY